MAIRSSSASCFATWPIPTPPIRGATPWSTPGGIPASLQDIIGQRVRSLGTRTARILAVASVIGVEFDVATLAEVAEIEAGTAADLIDGASRGGPRPRCGG